MLNSVQKFPEMQGWLPLTFSICLHNETTKTENTSFPFKTAMSEANVKRNRMATTKLTYHKEKSFTSNYFIFLENFVLF